MAREAATPGAPGAHSGGTSLGWVAAQDRSSPGRPHSAVQGATSPASTAASSSAAVAKGPCIHTAAVIPSLIAGKPAQVSEANGSIRLDLRGLQRFLWRDGTRAERQGRAAACLTAVFDILDGPLCHAGRRLVQLHRQRQREQVRRLRSSPPVHLPCRRTPSSSVAAQHN